MDKFNQHADRYHLLLPSYRLIDNNQSAYRQHRYTKIAITIAHNIIHAIDAGEVSVLVLLALSTAFNIVLLNVFQQ